MKKYFVMYLSERDCLGRGLPAGEKRFEIQLLDDEGRAKVCGHVGSDDFRLEISGEQIPIAVIRAAQRQRLGQGDYVNEDGDSVSLF